MSQKQTATFIYHLTMKRSKKAVLAEYGPAFWEKFQKGSDERFSSLIREFPDIGKSMFAFNYAYAPGYVAWYKTMEELSLSAEQRDLLMLLMNEKMLLTVPKGLLHLVGKAYLSNMRKGSALHVKRQQEGKLHDLDWKVDYRDVDKEHFEIDILECGFIKYARHYQAEGMLPGICQVDYMISHYMNVGFERTKTLGAGGCCCDGKYAMCGSCKWDPKVRLQERR